MYICYCLMEKSIWQSQILSYFMNVLDIIVHLYQIVINYLTIVSCIVRVIEDAWEAPILSFDNTSLYWTCLSMDELYFQWEIGCAATWLSSSQALTCTTVLGVFQVSTFREVFLLSVMYIRKYNADMWVSGGKTEWVASTDRVKH